MLEFRPLAKTAVESGVKPFDCGTLRGLCGEYDRAKVPESK